MLYKSNNQTEHIITEKAKKKEIKTKEKEKASFQNPKSQTFTLSIVRLRTKKYVPIIICYLKFYSPKQHQWELQVQQPQVSQACFKGHLSGETVSLLRIFSLFILLSPLESSLKLSNHYNAYNVFTRFLTKCAMFHLHCKLYINAIVLHISFCDTFSYKVCNVLLTL